MKIEINIDKLENDKPSFSYATTITVNDEFTYFIPHRHNPEHLSMPTLGVYLGDEIDLAMQRYKDKIKKL